MTKLQDTPHFRFLFIALIVLGVYGNTLNHGFVWDDHAVIEVNDVLGSLGNIPRFFVMEDAAFGPTGYYRPMTYVSFAVDRAVWGVNPVGFNITNIILHALVALLFYRVVAAIFNRDDLAFAAAVIFALHPIAGETVNFHAGGRNTLLCATFALLSLLYHVEGRKTAALICFVSAIFSKEFAILLPAVFLLYDLAVRKETPKWPAYLPYVVATGGYLALRSLSVTTDGNLLKAANFTDNFWIVPQTIVGYLTLMLNPFGVKTMYDVNNQVTWTSFGVNTAIVLALAALAVLFRKRLEILFGTFMFLLFLLPVTNILPLGAAMMADRYAYFALFGFSLVAAHLACLVGKKWIAVAVVASLCVTFAAIDIRRNGYWKDDVSFFTQVVRDAPLMSIGYLNLAGAYQHSENFPLAAKYFVAAQDKKDLTAKSLTATAVAFLELDRPDLALSALEKGMELAPEDPEPAVMASKIGEQLGDPVAARRHRDRASAMAPGIFERAQEKTALATRKGEAQLSMNNLVMAERFLYAAVIFDPSNVAALIDLGTIATRSGKPLKALHYFNLAVRLDPGNAQGYYKLASALETLGRNAEAAAAMKRFRELNVHS